MPDSASLPSGTTASALAPAHVGYCPTHDTYLPLSQPIDRCGMCGHDLTVYVRTDLSSLTDRDAARWEGEA